jgi:uncharacterized membrane protein
MILLVSLLFLTVIIFARGQELDVEAVEQNLSLDIYLYSTGKALVAGYVEDLRGLTFLRTAQYNALYPNQYILKYSYDNNTHQLYTWTDTLTRKNGENWSLAFPSRGFYSQCRIVFHLPGDLRLGRINSSGGLNYVITASNESLLVDAQGYRVEDPSIVIEYQQPLGTETLQDASAMDISSSSTQNKPILFAILVLILVGVAFVLVSRKRREKLSLLEANQAEPSTAERRSVTSNPNLAAQTLQTAQKALQQDYVSFEADPSTDAAEDEAENQNENDPDVSTLTDDMPLIEGGPKKEIKVSSEMAAVMNTLTPRERSILETLIKHGGRMTQMEMRYETGSPKSSLSMILLSLEKRKLIAKREFGRTNVVELSELFLSEK